MKYLILLLASLPLLAQNFCSDPFLEQMRIQAACRIKPLSVHAKEAFSFLVGKQKFKVPPTQAYCELTLEGQAGLPEFRQLFMPLEHTKTQKLLQARKLSYANLQVLSKVQQELTRLKLNDGYKKELTKILQRAQLYQSIKAGENWSIPENSDWVPFTTFFTEARVQQAGANPFIALLKKAKQNYDQQGITTYQTELLYQKLKPFTWASLLSLLALCLLVLFKKKNWVLIVFGASFLTQVVGIILRVMISGRAPITNMYETVMFSGFGALTLSLILYLFRKETFFLYGGLAYNFLCLLMMKFAHGMLDPAISPLVPVLRDNFWLSTHVTTIILSYAALALSWILANTVLLRQRFGKLSSQDFRYYSGVIYSCLKVGVVLLSAGVILGGLWADYSWGRFWGWDPKETWSLIVLVIYMAILHGRYTSWISERRFVPLVAGAFMSVMMAWFGVNYILATGLHSYGFSEGGAIFLGVFFTTQIFILLISKASERN